MKLRLAAAAVALAAAGQTAQAETVYVSNEKDNTITVVDGATLRWELEAVPEGTVLRLDERVASVDEAVEGGWLVGLHLSFARLEPALAGTPVPWDWDALAVAWDRYADQGLAIPGQAPRP